jgi:hypothetical protein
LILGCSVSQCDGSICCCLNKEKLG